MYRSLTLADTEDKIIEVIEVSEKLLNPSVKL